MVTVKGNAPEKRKELIIMMKAYIVARTNPDCYGYSNTYERIAYAENIIEAAIKATSEDTYNTAPEDMHNFWTTYVGVAEITDLTYLDKLDYITVFKTEFNWDDMKRHIVINLVNPDNIK